LNERISPITALEAKNKDIKNEKDIRPIFELSINPSTNCIIPWLLVCAGIISVINPCNWCFNPLFETNGRFGISVKINRQVGGMDKMKLKEMAAALSVRLGTLKPFMK
jgi:hypothetical protein